MRNIPVARNYISGMRKKIPLEVEANRERFRSRVFIKLILTF